MKPLAERVAAFATDARPDWRADAARLFRVAHDRLWLGESPAESIIAAVREQTAKRTLRRQARAIGLVYWPALRLAGVDPAAFVAAERVLIPLHGEWNPPASHGGWDSCGHHGVSPEFVRSAWFAAGCRNTEKFRLQIRSRTLARKGDTLPWLRDFVRGQRWAAAWGGLALSRKALAALGRLSPELRHAALRGVVAPRRIRDLNWAEVARIQALRADGRAHASIVRMAALPNRPAWAVINEPAETRCAHPLDGMEAAMICPAYPKVSREYACRILAGESPVEISGGTLTRKEAHQWLTAGGRETPAAWLVRELDLRGFVPRDSAVSRWLLAVHARNAASALHAVVRHPDGRQMARIDVLDEIQPVDLDRGPATGVERAFDNAARRLAAVDEGDHRTISRLPSNWPALPRCASLLTTAAALAAEGRVMSHCVGGYAHPVRAGQCWIVSLVSRHGRSTAELRVDGSIAQHKGEHNGPPPARHAALLRGWQTRLAATPAQRRAA